MNDNLEINQDDVDIDVVLKQHLSQREFRDEEAKSTLRVFATSTQTLDKEGIQRASFLEIEKDARLGNEDGQRIVKTLTPGGIKRIDIASIEVLTAIENFRPAFKRPLSEFSANAFDGISVGATKKEGKEWMCFVELATNGHRIRCSIGDFEQLHEFRGSLAQAGTLTR